MSNERRKFPRVSLDGDVSLYLSDVVRSGHLMNISPSGIQIECQHQLIEQLSQFKSEAGLYPHFELEFSMPNTGKETIKSVCNVSCCRRLSQDMYHLGLNFITLSENDEARVSDYIEHSAAA